MPNRYRALVLVALIFLVFSPSISGELITGDDEDLFARLESQQSWELYSIFAPSSTRTYYRPIMSLSYLIDKFIWQMNERIMHIENILLHAVNVLLVFFVSGRFLPDKIRLNSWTPFVAALLFGLHPIVSESVNWISGRTDLLAGTFILSSAAFLLIYLDRQRRSYLLYAAIFFAVGFLTKEVSVTFLLGMICIASAYWGKGYSRKTILPNMSRKFWFSLWCLTIPIGLQLTSFLAGLSNASKLSMTSKFIMNDLGYSFLVCLRAFGFYLKKLFWPFPLNFVILEVDPLYELAAIPIFLFCVYLIWIRKPLGMLFLTGAFLLIPSFLLAFGQIAWTPYAERYAYLPACFIVPAIVIFSADKLKRLPIQFSFLVSLILISTSAYASFERSKIWQSNVLLWQDTALKSPESASAWNDYGVALARTGDLEGALEKYQKASSLHNGSLGYDSRYDMNIASILGRQGKFLESRDVYERIWLKAKRKSPEALKGWKNVLQLAIEAEKNSEIMGKLNKELKMLDELILEE